MNITKIKFYMCYKYIIIFLIIYIFLSLLFPILSFKLGNDCFYYQIQASQNDMAYQLKYIHFLRWIVYLPYIFTHKNNLSDLNGILCVLYTMPLIKAFNKAPLISLTIVLSLFSTYFISIRLFLCALSIVYFYTYINVNKKRSFLIGSISLSILSSGVFLYIVLLIIKYFRNKYIIFTLSLLLSASFINKFMFFGFLSNNINFLGVIKNIILRSKIIETFYGNNYNSFLLYVSYLSIFLMHLIILFKLDKKNLPFFMLNIPFIFFEGLGFVSSFICIGVSLISIFLKESLGNKVALEKPFIRKKKNPK